MRNVIDFNKKRPAAQPAPGTSSNTITTLPAPKTELITQPTEYFLLNNNITYLQPKLAPKRRQPRSPKCLPSQIAPIIRINAFKKVA